MQRVIDNRKIEVVLGGQLGERYGKSHKLVARDIGEALRLLFMSYKPMRQEMVDAAREGAEYEILVDGMRRNEHDFTLPAFERIVIVPGVAGEKSTAGILEMVAGAVIIAFTWWNPLGWSTLAAEAGGGIGAGAAAGYAAGVSLILGGITSLLTTVPTSTASGDSLQSFYFNGASNTQTQGSPVPVIYGRNLVGSQAISASMLAVDLADAPAEVSD